MSGRGYEATGYLGMIIGAIVSVLLGVWVESKYSSNK